MSRQKFQVDEIVMVHSYDNVWYEKRVLEPEVKNHGYSWRSDWKAVEGGPYVKVITVNENKHTYPSYIFNKRNLILAIDAYKETILPRVEIEKERIIRQKEERKVSDFNKQLTHVEEIVCMLDTMSPHAVALVLDKRIHPYNYQ